MTLMPVLNESTGRYEILIKRPAQDPAPLPHRLHAQAATIEGANNSAYAIAEQLGSMGYPVSVEELKDEPTQREAAR